MSRWIDADAIMEELLCTTLKPPYKSTTDLVRSQEIATFVNRINSAPSIKTKEVKYFDEDEKVWKTGEVIVDG